MYLTPEGEKCVKKYVFDFHRDWVASLQEITDEQVQETVNVIEKLQQTMPGRRNG